MFPSIFLLWRFLLQPYIYYLFETIHKCRNFDFMICEDSIFDLIGTLIECFIAYISFSSPSFRILQNYILTLYPRCVFFFWITSHFIHPEKPPPFRYWKILRILQSKYRLITIFRDTQGVEKKNSLKTLRLFWTTLCSSNNTCVKYESKRHADTHTIF